jgi:hypothetical protein
MLRNPGGAKRNPGLAAPSRISLRSIRGYTILLRRVMRDGGHAALCPPYNSHRLTISVAPSGIASNTGAASTAWMCSVTVPELRKP